MQTRTYYTALRDSELNDGSSKSVEIHGKRLMVARLNGRLHVVENRCTHMGVPFEDGPLVDGHLVCPWHSARFCATSGDHRGGPGFCGLEKFPVRVRAGRIEIALKASDIQQHPLMGKRAAASFGIPSTIPAEPLEAL